MVMVSGKVDWFNGRASMVHPDYMAKLGEAENVPLVEPVHGLTAAEMEPGLKNRISHRAQALAKLRELLRA